MRLSKIYTKVGDKGQTQLANGATVDKSHPRIDAYGDVDELNSLVGLLIAQMTPTSKFADHLNDLGMIQNQLFDLGGELATPSESLNLDRQVVVSDDSINYLEKRIDSLNESLEPLKNFVLPGGSAANAQAHICRCVCRRAERKLVLLRSKEPEVRDTTQKYLNRLSDYFFVLSRAISKIQCLPEVIWDQKRP